jgi:hypothetical protein
LKSLKQKLKKLEAFSFPEWLILGEGLIVLPITSLLLGLRGVNWATQKFSDLRTESERRITNQILAGDERIDAAVPVITGIRAISTHTPFKFACLTRSTSACWMLRRRGLPAILKIGVKKTGDRSIAAHAWVELFGCALGEGSDLKRYLKFEQLSDRRIVHVVDKNGIDDK